MIGTNDKGISRYSDDFSMNQCSLMVRVDGKALEIPLNFGLTSDEIKRLYPYLAQFANEMIPNPAVTFGKEDSLGKYADLSDHEMDEVFEQANKQARYWYGRPEASVLELAVRFALDIRLLGIQELLDIFMPVSPLDRIQYQNVPPVTDEEADQIVQDMGLETEVDREHDPGDEQDIPLGIAGDLNVSVYESDLDTDYLSDELDRLEYRLDVKDDFDRILKGDTERYEREGHYATNSHGLNRDKKSLAQTVLGDDAVKPEEGVSDAPFVMYDNDTLSRDIFLQEEPVTTSVYEPDDDDEGTGIDDIDFDTEDE